MEFLETQKVDRFIEKLSRFEKQVFTTLKENQDKRLFDIIQVADDQLRLFSFAQLIVHETLDISHQYWKDIFLNYSTDNVKRLASSNEESRQSSLTYGEIDFFSFANILDRAEPKHGDVFVDLGHGIGKGLICAGLLYGHTFKQAFGVEIVSDLYSLSLRMIENYRANIHENPFFSEHECELLVEQGDLLSDSISEYWINADIIFANSTCFDDQLMRAMASLAERMKQGSRFITLTKQLPTNEFILLDRRQYVMSWGEATSFLHIRR